MARPNQYEKKVEPYLSKISEMALTMSEEQIAETLGISLSSWKRYKAQYEPLRTVLKRGRKDLVLELRGALIKKAKGFQYTETKEIHQKVNWPDELYALMINAGFTEEQLNQAETVRTEISHKYASPDVAAANLLLKNYDKENWANDPQALKLREREIELREKQVEQNDW